MIGKKEAEEIARKQGDVFFITDAGLDHSLYVYVEPYWSRDETEYFAEIREIIFEWEDKKEEKQRILRITENNIDFQDAPEEVQDAYRRHFFKKIDDY